MPFFQEFGDSIYRLPAPVLATSIFFILLACWRLYRFTLLPACRPDAPREYPYWFPYLGHALTYFRGSSQLMQDAQTYFRHANEVFALTLAGETIYVVTSPEDAVELARNTSTVSLEPFVKLMYTWTGVPAAQVEKMWEVSRNTEKVSDSRTQPAHVMLSEFHRQQLLPGSEHSATITKQITEKTVEALSATNLREHVATLEHSPEYIKVSLWGLCTQLFIESMADAYLGHQIWEIIPDLLEHSLVWESSSWKYIYQLPQLVSQDMHSSRSRLVSAFTQYFEAPKSKRADAAFFVQAFEQELRTCGFDEDEVARIFHLHYWAVTGNVYRVAFWLVAYVIHNPELLTAIKKEIQPAVSGDQVESQYLMNKCPILESTFNELLRVVSEGTLAREILSPTVIGGKILETGHKVIIPWRQLHLNSRIWGADALQFQPFRFYENKTLSRSPGFHPFGSGNMLCPGRFLARAIVFNFLASLISRYEITPSASGEDKCPQIFPRLDDSKPGFGALAPVPGDDLIISLKIRNPAKDI